MKLKIILISLCLICFIGSTALAQSREIPETEINIGLYFLGSTIGSLQERVGELTYVETKQNPYFPIAFDIYQDQGLEVQVVSGKEKIFSISTNVEDYSTPSGLHVGDSISKVNNLYGNYSFVSSKIKDNKRIMMWDNSSAMKRMTVTVDNSTNKISSIFVTYILD